MNMNKIIEEQLQDLQKVLEEIDATIESIAAEQPVIWFVKYKTIRNIVQYLPCEGIEMANEWAKKLDGQIMNTII